MLKVLKDATPFFAEGTKLLEHAVTLCVSQEALADNVKEAFAMALSLLERAVMCTREKGHGMERKALPRLLAFATALTYSKQYDRAVDVWKECIGHPGCGIGRSRAKVMMELYKLLCEAWACGGADVISMGEGQANNALRKIEEWRKVARKEFYGEEKGADEDKKSCYDLALHRDGRPAGQVNGRERLWSCLDLLTAVAQTCLGKYLVDAKSAEDSLHPIGRTLPKNWTLEYESLVTRLNSTMLEFSEARLDLLVKRFEERSTGHVYDEVTVTDFQDKTRTPALPTGNDAVKKVDLKKEEMWLYLALSYARKDYFVEVLEVADTRSVKMERASYALDACLCEFYEVPEVMENNLRAKRVQSIGIRICEMMAWLHKNGWAHLDLKPSNVLCFDKNYPAKNKETLYLLESLDEDCVKLCDYGISKPFVRGTLYVDGTAGRGTPAYASPEQLRESKVSAASDVFSFGRLLYALIFGAEPFSFSGSPSGAEGELSYPVGAMTVYVPGQETDRLSMDFFRRSAYASFESVVARSCNELAKDRPTFVQLQEMLRLLKIP